MKTLSALRLLQKQTKAEVFLTGGFVRDYLRGKKNDDYDIVVRKLPTEEILSFLEAHGSVKRVVLSGTEIETILFRAKDDRVVAQISLPRRGKKQIPSASNTLRQDCKYRDFKVNAMYLPINYTSRKDVVDHVGGMTDLRNRRISAVGSAAECVEMFPIRMIRAIALAARTDYKIDGKLVKAIRDKSALIKKEPVEAVRKQLNEILLSRKPSKYLRLMHRLGLLQFVMPELDRCYGVSQDKRYHKYDVFTHCVYTCDQTEKDLVMRLAGLLHDVGKRDTRREHSDGSVSFHKHEMASVKLAKAFLDRLRYDSRTKEAVLGLIRMHMYHYTRDFTDSAVRRFIRKADVKEQDLENLNELPLFKLRAAERLGNGKKKNPVTKRQKDFERRIKEVFQRGGGLERKDLDIDGRILMNAFQINGKQVGDLLNYLLERVRSDKNLNNRMRLMELALNYLKSRS